MVKVELLKELDNGIRFYSMENESLKIVVVNMDAALWKSTLQMLLEINQMLFSD